MRIALGGQLDCVYSLETGAECTASIIQTIFSHYIPPGSAFPRARFVPGVSGHQERVCLACSGAAQREERGSAREPLTEAVWLLGVCQYYQDVKLCLLFVTVLAPCRDSAVHFNGGCLCWEGRTDPYSSTFFGGLLNCAINYNHLDVLYHFSDIRSQRFVRGVCRNLVKENKKNLLNPSFVCANNLAGIMNYQHGL